VGEGLTRTINELFIGMCGFHVHSHAYGACVLYNVFWLAHASFSVSTHVNFLTSCIRGMWHVNELCHISVTETSREKEKKISMGEFLKESGSLIMEQSQPSIRDDSWHMKLRRGNIWVARICMPRSTAKVPF
jgi:hypothetical protein